MSGGWVAAGIVASAASSIYSSNKQSRAQEAASKRAERASAQALAQERQQFNKENQNEVDVSGILGANTTEGTPTMITGPGGISQGDLALGAGNSLLGRNVFLGG